MKKTLALLTIPAMIAVIGCLTGCSEKEEKPARKPSIVYPTEAAPVPDEVVQPIKDFFKSYNEQLAELNLTCTTPQTLVDAMKENGLYDLYVENKQDGIDATLDDWKAQYGDDVKIEYVKELTHNDLDEEHLSMAQTMLRLKYYDVKADLSFTEGYEVYFDYKTSGSKDTLNGTDGCCFVKDSKGGWFVILSTAADLEQYADIPMLDEVGEETEDSANG